MPSTPRVERIPTLRDNYTYLIIDEATREAAVVDAPEAAPVVERIEKLGVRLTKVLSTHHHPDHSAANPELAERYRVPVFGHQSDAKRLPGFTDGLAEGDHVNVGGLTAGVLFISRTRAATSPTCSRARCSAATPCSRAGGCSRGRQR
jgi:hydroxyacylglutathione hydrolase